MKRVDETEVELCVAVVSVALVLLDVIELEVLVVTFEPLPKKKHTVATGAPRCTLFVEHKKHCSLKAQKVTENIIGGTCLFKSNIFPGGTTISKVCFCLNGTKVKQVLPKHIHKKMSPPPPESTNPCGIMIRYIPSLLLKTWSISCCDGISWSSFRKKNKKLVTYVALGETNAYVAFVSW